LHLDASFHILASYADFASKTELTAWKIHNKTNQLHQLEYKLLNIHENIH